MPRAFVKEAVISPESVFLIHLSKSGGCDCVSLFVGTLFCSIGLCICFLLITILTSCFVAMGLYYKLKSDIVHCFFLNQDCFGYLGVFCVSIWILELLLYFCE